jgi:hypothetical protein
LGTEIEEVIREWRKWRNKEYNLHSSEKNIGMIKLSRYIYIFVVGKAEGKRLLVGLGHRLEDMLGSFGSYRYACIVRGCGLNMSA